MNYTGNDPIQKIIAYSRSYRYAPNFIRASTYLENLQEWAENHEYGYPPSGRGHDPEALTICCAYMPYRARGNYGHNSVPNQWTDGLVASGTIADLGGYNILIPGMELFQGTTHMGVYAGVKDFPISGNQHAVYQSVSQELINVEAMYEDANAGPNLTTMNSSQGWNNWGWPKGVLLDSAL